MDPVILSRYEAEVPQNLTVKEAIKLTKGT
jgi:hypothetical protein